MHPSHLAALHGSLAGNAWPAVVGKGSATLLAMLRGLEDSQWWPPEQLLRHQLAQIAVLLRHAVVHVPWYRGRLAGMDLAEGLGEQAFRALPLLTRGDIQAAGDGMASGHVPAGHGRVAVSETSGSTGRPITCRRSDLDAFFWNLFTLREHIWHERDFALRLAGIRTRAENRTYDSWGAPVNLLFRSGSSASLNIETPVREQARWLAVQDPDYLITFPSNLLALARRCAADGVRPARLREVRTYGEALHPELRQACRDAWGVPLVDMYSCKEAGYLALQCPDFERYHVMSEGVLIEVLDARGKPCGPGEIGRVVLTTLHAFAMPLVRYDIGDYAEVGPPCPCGRGLPTLERIVGRTHNMLRLASGDTRWPRFGEAGFAKIAPVSQLQVVQKALDHLDVALVVARPLTASEESGLRARVLDTLGQPMRVTFSYVDVIPRGAGGKYEDFRSEVAAP